MKTKHKEVIKVAIGFIEVQSMTQDQRRGLEILTDLVEDRKEYSYSLDTGGLNCKFSKGTIMAKNLKEAYQLTQRKLQGQINWLNDRCVGEVCKSYMTPTFAFDFRNTLFVELKPKGENQ